MKEKHICCICGGTFEGYGNNPSPLATDRGARCCDICDGLVILARLLGIGPKDTEEIKSLLKEMCGENSLGYKNIISKEKEEK